MNRDKPCELMVGSETAGVLHAAGVHPELAAALCRDGQFVVGACCARGLITLSTGAASAWRDASLDPLRNT